MMLTAKSRASMFACAGLVVAATGTAQLVQFSEDFEGLNASLPSALADAGWNVGANVFESDGTTFAYNYFTFPAPNGGPAFSAIDTGQGGPNQGLQQLSVYNDYNNPDHAVGRFIEANVFQEWAVGAGDAGTWTFTFDAKQGNIAGATTALAFIKVLDPGNGFALSDFATLDTTAIGTEWQEGLSVSVDIDAGQVGHIFQIGFWSIATNYESSGVFYDNVSLVPAPGAVGLLAVSGVVVCRRRRS